MDVLHALIHHRITARFGQGSDGELSFFQKKISKRIQLSGLKHAELKITAATDFDEHLLAVAAFPKGNGSVQHNFKKNIKILILKTDIGNSATLVK